MHSCIILNWDYFSANTESKRLQLIDIFSTLFYKLCSLQITLTCMGIKSGKNRGAGLYAIRKTAALKRWRIGRMTDEDAD